MRSTMLRVLTTVIGLAGFGMGSPAESGPGPFPIMAWDYADDEPTLRAMAECGVNSVAFVPEHALDLCHRLGLKAIVFHPRLTPPRWNDRFQSRSALEELPELVKHVNDHPAVMGYHLKDEPGVDQYAELGKAVEAVRRLAPGKWPYVNLLPGMGRDYDVYLEEFVKQCNPTVLSYDNYPLTQDGGFSYGYWANIAQVRNAAVRHGLPFWTIMLTAAHWNYAEPTPVTLRLQAYGALAYGARGIAYYKFISRELPILDAPDLGNWRGAPLDEFGARTQAWGWVQNLNRGVQKLGPTLLKLRSDVAYHVGEPPEQNRGIGEDTLVAKMGAGDAFVIGDFTHEEDGSRWVMIVNKHLTNSFACLPEFHAPVEKLEYVSPVTGELKPFPAPYYYLAPGQGVLLKLTPRADAPRESPEPR